MLAFEGDYRFRILEDAGDTALKRFSSGKRPHARSVNKLVKQIYKGQVEPAPTVLVMEEIESEGRTRTMGVCAWLESPLGGDAEEAGRDDDRYLHCIGVSRRYRRQILTAAGVTLGTALLGAALEQIELECGHRMPLVWARVAADNYRSHMLFEYHEFETFEAKGQTIRYRGGGLDPMPFPLRPNR